MLTHCSKNKEGSDMLGDLVALLAICGLALAPLVWRAQRDRQMDAALRVQAALQLKANQRLGGESFLVVTVEPPLTGGTARVRLSAPERWQWLIAEVWNDVASALPPGYELVVSGETARWLGVGRPTMIPTSRIPPRGRVASATHS
jgi:hypothetical protein